MRIAIFAVFTHFFFAPIPLDVGMNPSASLVRGRTVDGKTGLPLTGVRVTARSDVDVATTLSGSDGRFLFLTLLPGTYRICTSNARGYAASCEGEPKELFAGLEYGVTCVLSNTLR